MIAAKAHVISVVDDDPSLLKSLGRLLRAHGFEAHLFSSAESFLKADRDEKASCLVLDIHLGGISGIELQHELGRREYRIPVVIMTGKDAEATEQAARNAGCSAYLAKPFTTESLMDAISVALRAA